MKNRICVVMMMVAGLISLFSCSKEANGEGGDNAGGSSLMIKAQGASGGSSTMTVATPINIYVFDSAGKCVALKTMASENDAASISLPAGTYSVCGVAGASSDNYSLPAQDEATKQSVVTLKDGKKHSDLMAATQEVVLTDGESTEATLQMKRKVWMLTDVSLTSVPDNVVGVTMALSPLYEGITLGGEYAGQNGEATVELSKQSDGTTWSADCNLYLLESVSAPLFTFTFIRSDGTTRTFVYEGSDKFEANYKVGIDADYEAVSDPVLKCVISGVEWGGTNRLKITVKESGMTGGGSGSGSSGDLVIGDAPADSTVYKGCYVLKSEVSGNYTNVTLIAPKGVDKLTFTDGDQASIKAAVDEAISNLTGNTGLNGWRLPTLDEIKSVEDDQKSINAKLSSYGMNIFYTNSLFYYQSSENSIYCYSTSNGKSFSPTSGKASNVLRPFATVRFFKPTE